MIDYTSPLLLRISQIATYRGRHRNTVYERWHRGTLPYEVINFGVSAYRVPLLDFLRAEGLDAEGYWSRIDALPDLIGPSRMRQETGLSQVLVGGSFVLNPHRVGNQYPKQALLDLLGTHKSCHATPSARQAGDRVSRHMRRTA